jgi:hypothetical protein
MSERKHTQTLPHSARKTPAPTRKRGGVPKVKGLHKPAQNRKRTNEHVSSTNISELLALHRVKPSTLSSKLDIESDDDNIIVGETKDVKMQATSLNKELLIGLGAFKGKHGLTGTFDLYLATAITTNATAGKYSATFLTFSTSTLLWASMISSFQEIASLEVLFDELFVRQIQMVCIPHNKYLGTYVSATGVNLLSSGMGATSFLPHNAGAYTDTSTMVPAMMTAAQSKLINTADGFTFTMRNPEKFAWDGPFGDQSTSTSTMGWCAIGTAGTKYGGLLQLATLAPCAAATTTNAYDVNTFLFDAMFKATISFRMRA